MVGIQNMGSISVIHSEMFECNSKYFRSSRSGRAWLLHLMGNSSTFNAGVNNEQTN